jgi:hypothetical protein
MIKKIARISGLAICLIVIGSLFCNFQGVSAGTSAWSPEPIPSSTNNLLGPDRVDVRDLALFNDGQIIYAAPGDSVAHTIYRSTDGGNTWTPMTVSANVDLIATMPEDDQVLAIADKSALKVYLSVDAGIHWEDMGVIQDQDSGGAQADAIDDIAISPQWEGINYLAVAGNDSAGAANLWYYKLGIGLPDEWFEAKKSPVFNSANETVALAFSPTFGNDATAAVITNNSTDVTLALLHFGSDNWTATANYTGFPQEIVSSSGTIDSASLALAPDFNGYEPEASNVFIGLTVHANQTASGIYRLEDMVLMPINTNITINSIAFNGDDLVAGSSNNNTVYSCNNPYDAVPTIEESDPTKSPGGTGNVVVAWANGVVVAGTSGDESAFAISEDNGFTFNDISLIDTAINNAEDVAVAEEGDKIYLVTDDGADLSVWLFNGVWRRVFSKMSTTNYIVRIASGSDSDSDSVYLAKTDSTEMYYSNTGGTTQWQDIICGITVQDLAVESPQVIYSIDTDGWVASSTNGGSFWTKSNTFMSSGATIVSVSPNVVLAGSQDGFVAYTFNGGLTWANILQPIKADAGNVQVIADENFAENKTIYAASDKINGSIWRYTIGTSTEWTDIYSSDTGGDISGGVYGLAMTNDVIYALEYASGNSTLLGHLSPATIPENSTEWSESPAIDYAGHPIILNATPQGLRFTTGKLWAVSPSGTNGKLYSYTDVLANTEITLLNPIDGYLATINGLNTYPPDVTFTWERPSVAIRYEFVMAQDPDFVLKVATILVPTHDNTSDNTSGYTSDNTSDSVVHVTIGPHQSGDHKVFYTPSVTYYWKVRAILPSYTAYSETRHFVMGPLPPEGFEPVKLIPDEITSLVNPSFAWWPMSGITEYQFVLSDNPEMTSPLINVYLDTTTFKTGITLEYGKHYFWRVRPSQPMVSGWSATLTFMLTGPITTIIDTVTQQGQTTYVPFYITFITTPGYVVGAITVGLILVGTIIVLLFSRRNVNISRGDSMRPQLKLDHYTDFPAVSIPAETFEQQPKATEFDKEGPDIVQDAKHFLWTVTQQEEVTALGQKRATEKDRDSHGKKLASKIHDLSKKVTLYVKYPEDAATLLAIWAEYRSKKETSNYLVKSFDANPYNAIKFLKCYLPTAHLGEEVANIKDFDTVKYNLIAEVIDVTKMYETLSKLFKFKAEEIEDIVPVTPFDRDLATQFLRLHIKTKGVS